MGVTRKRDVVLTRSIATLLPSAVWLCVYIVLTLCGFIVRLIHITRLKVYWTSP